MTLDVVLLLHFTWPSVNFCTSLYAVTFGVLKVMLFAGMLEKVLGVSHVKQKSGKLWLKRKPANLGNMQKLSEPQTEARGSTWAWVDKKSPRNSFQKLQIREIRGIRKRESRGEGPRTTCSSEAPKMRKGYKKFQFHFGCLRGTALSPSWVQFPYGGL